MLLALGRGAAGGGRLKSEAFTAGRLDAQLTDDDERLSTQGDRCSLRSPTSLLSVNPIFSWREAVFCEVAADGAPESTWRAVRSSARVLALIDRCSRRRVEFLEEENCSAWPSTISTGD